MVRWHSLKRRTAESRLRRRLRAELAACGIEGVTSMKEVADRLGQRRGKPIKLLAYPLEVPGPFGLWLATSSADYIIYQEQTTEAHQRHIIAHELGHILAEHHSDEDDDAAWRELMPDIPPEMIRRALRRTHYDNDHEREAETAATILLEAAAASVSVPGRSARARRAQEALGDPQGWL